jgi:chaperonin GroES
MKLRPLGERIYVKQHDEDTTTESGIVLAVEASKKFKGTVIGVGPGKMLESGERMEMELKPGDVIMFGEYSGQKFKMDGEEYLMMNEADVIGVVE